MPRGNTQPFNHPAIGSSIKVEPIRDRVAIESIKQRLRTENPRNYCLFVLGINTAYRGSELLSLKVGQVSQLYAGDVIEIKQKKTRKYRSVTLNNAAFTAIRTWLTHHPMRENAEAPLFLSHQGQRGIGVSSLNRLVKKWCADAGLEGNFGSHTLRKTWGYHQRMKNDTPIPLLMAAYGHATQAQTMAYLHIQAQEISDLYTSLEL